MNHRESLLRLRSNIAFALKTEHSFSFSDEQLENLLIKQPKTLDELGGLKGFPRDGKRVAAFGQQIIDIFNNKAIKDFDVKVSEGKLIINTEFEPLKFFN